MTLYPIILFTIIILDFELSETRIGLHCYVLRSLFRDKQSGSPPLSKLILKHNE